MTAMEQPSVSRLAGQLVYLFEDDPELRSAPVEVLVERLNHDDRFARARATYPLDSDAEIARKVGELEARITTDDVVAARAVAVARGFDD
jgi:hypothetical protein